VSWAVNGDSIGWCPLGYQNRPVLVRGGDARRSRGYAVPRDSAAGGSAAWVFARRQDLTARTVAGRHFASAPEAAQVTELTHGRLGRDLQVRENDQTAVPREGRTKPGPGDTVPELRDDNMVTIPRAIPRTRYESERERNGDRERPRRGFSPQQDPGNGNGNGGQAEGSGGEAAVPRSPGGNRPAVPWSTEGARPENSRPAEARPRPAQDSDREVLRPVFERLGRPQRERDDDSGRAERARPRPDAPQRESQPAREQPRVAPPPPPPPPPQHHGSDDNHAAPRKKDHNN
jgi:hypothetical protein